MKADINSILCFGYQVLGEKAKNLSVWDFPDRRARNLNDDYAVCKAAYEILKDADAIITHNGKNFDLPFLRTRLKKNKLPSLPPKIVHIDTKEIASREYFLFSNKLSDLAEFLGVGSKLSTSGKKLWTRIFKGDTKAEREMDRYNIRDVSVTTKCALAMRDVTTNWPNQNIGSKTPVCRACGGKHLHKRGFLYTSTTKRQRYQCLDCGTYMTSNTKGKLS
jgi:DNA polymerase elongation subunit (family B)